MRDMAVVHPPSGHLNRIKGGVPACDCLGIRRVRLSVLYLPGLSRYFDCFDSILEWDGMSGMEVVFDSLILLAVLIV